MKCFSKTRYKLLCIHVCGYIYVCVFVCIIQNDKIMLVKTNSQTKIKTKIQELIKSNICFLK